MNGLDKRICAAIERLDQKFGPFNYVICGSVGLYMQGVDLGRDFHDIDIFIPGKRRELYIRFFNLVYKRSGFKLDFPIRPLEGMEITTVNNFHEHKVLLQDKYNILKVKETIVQQQIYKDPINIEKQRKDIEKIKSILNI